jgi:isovaleryl-CoA dehydrogenase
MPTPTMAATLSSSFRRALAAVARGSSSNTAVSAGGSRRASTSSTASSSSASSSSSSSFPGPSTSSFDGLFNPTHDHRALRDAVRSFAMREIEPQALSYNRDEAFNVELFRKFGSADRDGLGILGLTVPEEYGGTGMNDAPSVCIVHEELSYADPGLCLSYLAHSVLFANNLAVNGSREQVR